jgi:hypothetical protein
MMAILKGVDSGNRLAEDDVVWLIAEAEEYFTDEVQEAYHLREAEFYAGEYRRTQERSERQRPLSEVQPA